MIRENVARSKAAAATQGSFEIQPMLKRSVIVPLLLSMALMFFQQWCGVNAVIFYTVTIFKEAQSGGENLATIIVGIVQFLATFASIFLVDKAGRRILLILSGLIMAVALATVGAYFYLLGLDEHEGLELIPLVGLNIFMVGYSVGFASIPFVIMGELFPNQYRNILSSISSSFNLTCTFLVIKLFGDLQGLIGMHGIFWLYGGAALIGSVFVALALPETKGKTLEEIEAHFRKQEQDL